MALVLSCIFRLSVMNNKAIWPISHFMEHSQSKEDIHLYRLYAFFAIPLKTNLYKSVKFCHFECRSKQNVDVMFT